MNRNVLAVKAASLVTALGVVISAPFQTEFTGSRSVSAVVSAAEQLKEMIVYSTLAPRNLDLYLFEKAGEKGKRLTTDPALDYNPVFSPDGRWIVFCSERRGNPDLYALNLQSEGPPRLLTNSEAMEDAPTFSPDGRFLAFVSDRHGNADIFVMPFNPDDPEKAFAQAVNLSRHSGGDLNPAFSPDGRKIAFSSDRDSYSRVFVDPTASGWGEGEVYVMDADGSNPTRITYAEGWDGSPAWSSDGKSLYFYSQRDVAHALTSGFRIWRMNADGSDPRPLSPTGLSAVSPAVSPSGRVAFSVLAGPGSQILSVAADGSDQHSECDGPRGYQTPAFDPRTGRVSAKGPVLLRTCL